MSNGVALPRRAAPEANNVEPRKSRRVIEGLVPTEASLDVRDLEMDIADRVSSLLLELACPPRLGAVDYLLCAGAAGKFYLRLLQVESGTELTSRFRFDIR
jgi:hypothetical protein